jgi:hypothetical protein
MDAALRTPLATLRTLRPQTRGPTDAESAETLATEPRAAREPETEIARPIEPRACARFLELLG